MGGGDTENNGISVAKQQETAKNKAQAESRQQLPGTAATTFEQPVPIPNGSRKCSTGNGTGTSKSVEPNGSILKSLEPKVEADSEVNEELRRTTSNGSVKNGRVLDSNSQVLKVEPEPTRSTVTVSHAEMTESIPFYAPCITKCRKPSLDTDDEVDEEGDSTLPLTPEQESPLSTTTSTPVKENGIGDGDNSTVTLSPPPTLASVEEMELGDDELVVKEDPVGLALKGNPKFAYQPIGNSRNREMLTYKCLKCPTAVDRMERLAYHYKFHGSNKRYKCNRPSCDFAVDHQHILVRHLERHDFSRAAVKSTQCPSSTSNPEEGENNGNKLYFDGELSSDESANNGDGNGFDQSVAQFGTVSQYSKSKKRKKRPTVFGRSKFKRVPRTKPKKNSYAALHMSDDDYVKFQAGNPTFYYQPYYKTSKGKKCQVRTYKCLLCPSAYVEFPAFSKHLMFHDANLPYKCQVCNYSAATTYRLQNHLHKHKLQGNLPEDLLTVPPPSKKNVSSKLVPLSSEEVALLGNEDDFEIEFDMEDDDIISDEEIVRLQPMTKRQKTDYAPLDSSISDITNNAQLKQVPVVMLERLVLEDHDLDLDVAKENPKMHAEETYFTHQDSESYSIKCITPKKFNAENYLLTQLSVTNFMPFPQLDMDLSSDAIEFVSDVSDGKSASIIAALVALGYDVLVENHNPTGFCGWELRDLITRGNDTAKLEIILSLKCFPELQDKYGSHMRLERTLHRGVPLSSCYFQISSADKTGTRTVPPKIVSMANFRSILKQLNVLPAYYRLMLLDRENMKQITNDMDSWYAYFEEAINLKTKLVEAKISKVNLILTRLDNDMAWRKARLDFLRTELQTEYPFEKPTFQDWRTKDIEHLSKSEKELAEFNEKYAELQEIITEHTREISDLASVLLKEMNQMLDEFLQSQNYIGSILIDEEAKKMGIWIREKSLSTQKIPTTLEEARTVWLSMNPQKRTTAVFGLYLSFWKINESCPFFAVDSYSSSDLEFRFPAKGLPILLKLIEKKERGQQFFMTLPYPKSPN